MSEHLVASHAYEPIRAFLEPHQTAARAAVAGAAAALFPGPVDFA